MASLKTVNDIGPPAAAAVASGFAVAAVTGNLTYGYYAAGIVFLFWMHQYTLDL